LSWCRSCPVHINLSAFLCPWLHNYKLITKQYVGFLALVLLVNYVHCQLLTKRSVLGANDNSPQWDGTFAFSSIVRLFWRFGAEDDKITLRFEVDSQCWIGLGWNPDSSQGEMTDADMVILSKVGAELKLEDYWSVGYITPTKDTSDNLEEKKFGQSEERTWFEFTRKWKTTDSKDNEIHRDSNFFIWAYGDSNTFEYHGPRRGHSKVDFSTSGQIASEDDHHHHDDDGDKEEYQHTEDSHGNAHDSYYVSKDIPKDDGHYNFQEDHYEGDNNRHGGYSEHYKGDGGEHWSSGSYEENGDRRDFEDEDEYDDNWRHHRRHHSYHQQRND